MLFKTEKMSWYCVLIKEDSHVLPCDHGVSLHSLRILAITRESLFVA